jgi:hypothetical protein
MADRTLEKLGTRKAPISLATANDTDLTLECTMASEAPVRVMDWASGDMIREILPMSSLMDAPATVPLLNSHERAGVENVLGHVSDIRIEGDKLVGRVRFAQKDPAAKSAYEKYRAGHLTDFSIGYQIQEMSRIDAGESLNIGGREYVAQDEMPLRVATKWTLRELSAVPIGADPQAKARAEEKPEAGLGVLPQSEKESQMASDKVVAVPPAEKREEADVKTVDVDAVRKEAIALERKRQAEIEAEMKGVELTAEQAIAIRSSETVDAARALLLDVIRAQKPAAVIVRPTENPVDSIRAIECAAVRASGVSEELCAKEYGAQTLDQSKKFRNLGPLGISRNLLRLNGKHVPDDATDTVRAVFEMSARSDAASTSHLGFLLGNIANKSLLKGYTEQADSWSKWCTVKEVADYKLNTAARFGLADGFTKVGDGGEIHHTSATEEGEQYQVDIYAEAYNITEKQLVNDDQSAFSSVPQRLGAAAKRYISKLVYTAVGANGTMNDGKAWLGTDHSNYITGTDTVLDATYAVAGLDLAMAKMLKQTGLEGEPLDLMPTILLVAPEAAMVAASVFQSSLLVSGITNRVANANPFAGRFQVVVDSRLSATSYTGYSTTAWYLIDPTVENMTVAFLRGNREPRIESFQMDPATFGIKYRASLRAGVKATDYRGIVKSKGAS